LFPSSSKAPSANAAHAAAYAAHAAVDSTFLDAYGGGGRRGGGRGGRDQTKQGKQEKHRRGGGEGWGTEVQGVGEDAGGDGGEWGGRGEWGMSETETFERHVLHTGYVFLCAVIQGCLYICCVRVQDQSAMYVLFRV
jgi:hypothetical protein